MIYRSNYIYGRKDYKALTNTTREENLNSIYDEFGVRYTADGKKLISTPVGLVGDYKIKPCTESICDSAFQFKVDLGVCILFML